MAESNSDRLKDLRGEGSGAQPAGPLPWENTPSVPPGETSAQPLEPVAGPPVSAAHASPGEVNAPSFSAPPATPAVPVQPRNGKGTASLVLGIIGMVPFPITGFWCSLIAIIMGHQGKERARDGEATNGSIAMAGFVLGIIGLALQTLLGLALIFS